MIRTVSRWTPTRVGQTLLASGGGSSAKVDPHSRGANDTGRAHIHIKHGGPPLAWGKLLVLALPPPYCGWTPTRVGQTQ